MTFSLLYDFNLDKIQTLIIIGGTGFGKTTMLIYKSIEFL